MKSKEDSMDSGNKRKLNQVKAIFILFFSLVFFFLSKSQPLSLDNLQLEEQVRRAQLLGKIDKNLSFNIRPVQPPRVHAWDTALDSIGNKPLLGKGAHFLKNFGYIDFTPFQLHQQYVTKHPFKENDGPIIPASGYQNMISGGIFLKLGPLTIQAKPQLIYAKNDLFQGFPTLHSVDVWNYMNVIWGTVDIPERFGYSDYKRNHFGNSSVHLNIGPIAAGVSSQNLSWGPTVYYPVIISNHAPGFIHGTVNTKKPIRTPIGSFEFQVISGILENSNFEFPERDGARPVVSKINENRYINAGTLSFQPWFLKGLHIGVSRIAQVYASVLKRSKAYLPIFANIDRQNDDLSIEFNRDQNASVFFRWVIPKAKAEFYGEWGRNDAFFTWRDFIQMPEHSRAYTFGFRKIFDYKQNGHWEILSEMTKMQQPITWPVRDANSWYQHVNVLHGLTHRGEILGSYVGLGGNAHVLRVTRLKGMKQMGLQFERLVNNNNFYEHMYQSTGINKWVDYTFTLFGQYDFNNFLINAKFAAKKSFNYQWYQPEGTTGRGLNDPFDISTYMGQLSILYRL